VSDRKKRLQALSVTEPYRLFTIEIERVTLLRVGKKRLKTFLFPFGFGNIEK